MTRVFPSRYLCLIPVAGALALAGCGVKTKAATATPAPNDPMEITPRPNVLAMLKLGEPQMDMVNASLKVAARVEVDETRVARVGSPVMGRVTSLSVQEGEEVRRGQVLALLNSPGLSEAQLAFLKAISEKQLASRAVERAKLLVKSDVIGIAELQRREAEDAQAGAELAGATDQLALLGMSAEAVEELRRTRTMKPTSRVVATNDGTVLHRHVAVGQVVQPADTMFEIADLSRVWLVADVPEHNAGYLETGQTVRAEIEALAGEKLEGHLNFVSSTVDSETRTVRARMSLANARRRLKPAMLATMELLDQADRRLLVPQSAVVRDGDVEYVFVERTPGTFQLRPVKCGAEFGARRVLLEGVQLGEKIVMDGAFHLNNERRRRAVRGGEGE